MQSIIREKLNEIEQRENVRILYAAESGSRAWGFASPDSDYDVRFLYVRPVKDYLAIQPVRDVIEWQLDETLDINGWDLQKAFRLLLRSNPTLFEWSNSPIVYRSTAEWEALLPIINDYFSSRSGMCHYLAMASGNYRDYLTGARVRVKKYLYVLRPILACRWIMGHGTPPPMLFSSLVEAELAPELLPEVTELLRIKSSASEADTLPQIKPLNEYITSSLQELTEAVHTLPEEHRPYTGQLDTLFVSILQACSPEQL